MFFLNKYEVNKNNSTYNLNKQNIFIVIRKSPGEYDFIAYILNKLKKKFNIFFIFNNNKSYELLKKNKFLFKNFKKISFGYMINPKYNYLFSRIFFNILTKLGIKTYQQVKKLNQKIYNFEKLKFEINKKFKLNNKIFLPDNNVLFCSFENKSGWLGEFKEKYKVIFFPEKTNLVNQIIQNKKKNNSKKNILALFPNKEFHNMYINKIEFKNYLYCGYPKFDKYWYKLFLKKNYKKINSKATIFFKTLESKIAFDKKKYFHQLNSIISILKKYGFTINFNLHPLAKNGFNDYFTKEQLKNFKISQNTIAQDINESNLLLFKYGTNSILDCIALGKYPIELWSLKYKKYFSKSVYQSKKLSIKCENIHELEKLIKNSLKKTKYPFIDKQKKKYFLSSKKTKEITEKIEKFIEF